MYRLLKLTNYSTRDRRILSQSFSHVVKSNNPCSFCNITHRTHGIFKTGFRRYQSTQECLQPNAKIKKRIRKSKKLSTELLSEDMKTEALTETRMSVGKFNKKHLFLLTNSKFEVDELQKATYSNNFSSFAKHTNPKSVLHDDLPNDLLLHDHFDSIKSSESLLDDPEVHKNFIEELEDHQTFDDGTTEQIISNTMTTASDCVDKKKPTRRKRSKKDADFTENMKKFQELEKQAKSESLSRIVLAYADLCVAHDKTNRGLQALYYYLDRARRNAQMPKILNIKVYNCLIEGFAAKGNYSKVGEVLSIMKKENILPNLQTYVGIFECLGHLAEKDSIKLLESYRKDIESKGYQLNDLLDKGMFIGTRRESVLVAIRRLIPDFEPKYTKPNIQYNCDLLNQLNHPDQINLLENLSKLVQNDHQNIKFLNSNINQLDNDLFITDIKHKNNIEIKRTQLLANIQNLLTRKSLNLESTLETNTYDPLTSNFSTFIPVTSCTNNIEMMAAASSSHTASSTTATTATLPNFSSFKNFVEEYIKVYVPAKPNIESGIKVNIKDDKKLKMFTTEELKQRAKEQIKLEQNGFIQVNSIVKQNEDPVEVVNHFRTKLKETEAHWTKVIKTSISRDLQALQSQTQATGGARGTPSLHECLHALPIDDLVQIVLQEVRKVSEGSETYSPTLSQLYREIGQVVHSRYQVKLKQSNGVLDKVDNIYGKYCDWYANYYLRNDHKERTINSRQYWQALVYADQTGPTLNNEDRIWPFTLIVAVGKFLYNIILKDLKINVNAVKLKSKQSKLLPAFYTLFRTQGHIVKEEIKAHPVITRLFQGAALPQITFHASLLPMYCPPKPWVDYNGGGYLVTHTDMLRLPPQATQQIERVTQHSDKTQLYPSFDSLNQLGAVPWCVNEPILDLLIDIFQSGGSSRLGVAQHPSTCPAPPPLGENPTKQERFQAFRLRLAVRRRKAEMYSLWCDALYRLSLANHFRGKIFWLPHNMDFRGRVYPVPPHLTHLGSDLARSLLVFADKQPLGPHGLRWLKLHLVNLCGTKKRFSIEERLEYINTVMNEIFDSADNPLNGRMWWAESEEPWQTLACCKEIANAIRSPDHTKYMTNYPVHQDGSCNGLQHYAALGRDTAGAKSVNLTPSEYAQDVYSAVATLVEEQRKKDAEQGVPIAKVLDGFVQRKVIKQTVMTTVYGVTRFGARLQIAKQLKDLDDFPKESVWQASSYLTTKTFESLRSMFTSTREIQDWFTDCARFISGQCLQNVEWITPLGLPVVQPYNRYRKLDHTSHSKNYISEHYAMDSFERPNVMKQKNAFPPNFIHSLDSSHMMLTSIYCERAGISFVSVHDCFWTHPSTVQTMNKICREQFVALHSQPILENLSEFLCDRYIIQNTSNENIDGKSFKILRKLPQIGDFNLDSVLKSVYFFS
ncbi:DNA-directed RNA polymerase, mitochondrial [Chrysoperla carnea]|uniref:DNA-directed RNA polymerase, mitochondrial n=1 Tax=Chrysoperla carnea TaxID=189513 RepID=UPI001D070A50|nr:DNA-directed RNA polymerase, mitochondrial [Chrysoperla carnea]